MVLAGKGIMNLVTERSEGESKESLHSVKVPCNRPAGYHRLEEMVALQADPVEP